MWKDKYKVTPETMKRNLERNQRDFPDELKWMMESFDLIRGNNFLLDMYHAMTKGERKITDKMIAAIRKSMNDPRYNVVKQVEAKAEIQPILEKIDKVLKLVSDKDVSIKTIEFIQSVRNYVESNYRITKKQMQGLNKIWQENHKL